MKRNKIAQIWLETVIYTLIGLALIGIVLAVVTPKINQAKDKMIVEQSIEVLNVIDDKVKELVNYGPGNIRVIEELKIKSGELIVDGKNETIYFVISGLSKPYSEPGVKIQTGDVIIFTEKKQKTSTVYLTLNYNATTNITYGYDRDDVIKKFNPATNAYELTLINFGTVNGKTEINIQETSGA